MRALRPWRVGPLNGMSEQMIIERGAVLWLCRRELYTHAATWVMKHGAGRAGLSSDTMALITTDCDAMRSLRTKWP